MKTKNIQERTKKFSINVFLASNPIKKDLKEFFLGDQLMRSSFSIGANVHEAQGAISKKAFSQKIAIAHGEAWETIYWLEILLEMGFINSKTATPLIEECKEIRAILYSILKTTGRIRGKNN